MSTQSLRLRRKIVVSTRYFRECHFPFLKRTKIICIIKINISIIGKNDKNIFLVYKHASSLHRRVTVRAGKIVYTNRDLDMCLPFTISPLLPFVSLDKNPTFQSNTKIKTYIIVIHLQSTLNNCFFVLNSHLPLLCSHHK